MTNSSDSGPRNVASIVRGQRKLASMIARARAYGELERQLLDILPRSVRGHLRISCVRDRCLVVAAESPAWATRLRTLAPALLSEARCHWPTALDEVRIITITDPGSS